MVLWRHCFGILTAVFISGFAQSQDYSVNDLLGKFDPANHPQFSKISAEHTSKESIYLRIEVNKAFAKMFDAAKKEGIQLQILSATRNFNHQKGIWTKKWNLSKYKGWTNCDKVKDIMKYSSVPGTSRHHWGTDIDINSLDNSYFETGNGKKVYDWLCANASKFGFYQTYTSKTDGRTGYEEEKWHWSYFSLSTEMLDQYNQKIGYGELQGFDGSECAEVLDIIKMYVNGIAKAPVNK